MNPIIGMGELLWDIYPDGRRVAGGAPFNFTFHCHQLGHPARIVSRVGDDELGRALRDEVRRLDLSEEFIQTDYDFPTGTVQVTLDQLSTPAYTITENVAWDHLEWNDALREQAGRASALCVGTLAQRCKATAFAVQSMLAAVRFGPGGYAYRIFDVNLRQHYFSREAIAATLFRSHTVKVNEDELRVLATLMGWSGTHRDELVAELFRFSSAETRLVIVTRGSAGSAVYFAQGSPLLAPAAPAHIRDTVGAGDAFTAAMVCLHREGRSWPECAVFASHYAARVCEHVGATPYLDRHEVELTAFGN